MPAPPRFDRPAQPLPQPEPRDRTRVATTRTTRTSRGPTTTRARTATTSRCSRRSRCTSCCRRRRPPAVASSGSRRTRTKARCPRPPTIRVREWSRAGGASSPDGCFNLAVCLDGETTRDGRPVGRVVACSTFHHFADMNWDIDARRAVVRRPTRPATRSKRDPFRLTIFKDYVHNIARWLAGG